MSNFEISFEIKVRNEGTTKTAVFSKTFLRKYVFPNAFGMMWHSKIKFSLLLLLVSSVASDKVSYTNYQVFRMSLKADNELTFVGNLVGSCDGCSYWSGLSTSRLTSVMVPPSRVKLFTDGMSKSNISYEKFIEDVQEMIDNQVNSGNNDSSFGWTRYHTLNEVYSWLDSVAKKYPKNVEIIIGGRSYEGRAIKGVKISFKKNNPGVFIECAIHSWEWVTTATGTYLINQFLTSKDPKVRKLAESFEWYIFSSTNPDGYVYSHEKDRFWLKTRSPQGSGCYGVNLNRNWGYMWNVTTTDPCDARYAGKMGFSEIETTSLSEYIASLKDKLFTYISFHSFSQLLMVPYSYTTEHLDNYDDAMAIAAKAIEALSKRYGTKYEIGSPGEVFYTAPGATMDWVKGSVKLQLVFEYELRDQGDYGMLLPPSQIIPNCEEVLDSLLAMFDEAKRLGYPKK